MSAQNYADLRSHVGHEIVVATYDKDKNVAIECVTCFEVLLDYDNEGEIMCGDCIRPVTECGCLDE
jgi:hypothetical protein